MDYKHQVSQIHYSVSKIRELVGYENTLATQLAPLNSVVKPTGLWAYWLYGPRDKERTLITYSNLMCQSACWRFNDALSTAYVIAYSVCGLSNSVTSEPECPSSCTQEIVICPYPEIVESASRLQASLPKIHSDPILPSTPWSSWWSLSLGFSHKNLVHVSLLSCAY
jgi:hypothetical protein